MRRRTGRPHRQPRRRALRARMLRNPGAAGAHACAGAVIARFATLASFYGEDARRAASPEVDVGLWWREGADGPLHRAAWVAATGELYAVRLGPAQDAQPAVELLAVFDDEAAIDAALPGWRERCGEALSLGWLRERAAAASQVAAPRRTGPEWTFDRGSRPARDLLRVGVS